MKPEPECAGCLMTWLVERIAVTGSDAECWRAARQVAGMIREDFYPSANVGSLANRSIEIADRLIAQAAGHFEKIKSGNNRLALQTLDAAGRFVESGQTDKDAFERACAVAAAGNVAPIGLPSGIFRFEEVENILAAKGPSPVCRGDAHAAAKRASHVLYAADNSGEIGFDSLLIARLKAMGKRVTLVVKEGPFFEDAAEQDVSFFGLDRMVDEVLTLNGFFVTGELPSGVRRAFEKSDLVISKGTGNFEGLKDETHGKKTIFMLKIKCGPISRKLGLGVGSFVVHLDG